MNKLTKEQREEFRLRGFVSGLRAFGPAEAQRIAAELEDVNRAWNRVPYDGMGLETRFPSIMSIATNPAILDVVEGVLGANILLFNTQLVFKDAHEGDSPWPWHQDACANHGEFADPSQVAGDVPLTLRAWLAIDDVDRTNGTLRICPGSHTRLLPHDTVRWRQFDRALHIPPSVFDPSHAEYVELQAGHFCIFHDTAVHGSEPNASGRRRWAISLHYTRPDVRFDPEFWTQSTFPLLRGIRA